MLPMASSSSSLLAIVASSCDTDWLNVALGSGAYLPRGTQRVQQTRHLVQLRLHHPGELRHGRLQGARQLREEHVARRQLGQRIDLLRRDRPPLDDTRLDGRLVVVLARELGQYLGGRDRVVVPMTRAVGPRKNSATSGNSLPCSARSASVFFTTRYSTPALRRRRRRSVMLFTFRPVKSVR
jgi:hypothetical protein